MQISSEISFYLLVSLRVAEQTLPSFQTSLIEYSVDLENFLLNIVTPNENPSCTRNL